MLVGLRVPDVSNMSTNSAPVSVPVCLFMEQGVQPAAEHVR